MPHNFLQHSSKWAWGIFRWRHIWNKVLSIHTHDNSNILVKVIYFERLEIRRHFVYNFNTSILYYIGIKGKKHVTCNLPKINIIPRQRPFDHCVSYCFLYDRIDESSYENIEHSLTGQFWIKQVRHVLTEFSISFWFLAQQRHRLEQSSRCFVVQIGQAFALSVCKKM